MSLTRVLSKSLLYACGPFFCYPWKPIINEASGVSYDVAYKHFWAQHKDPLNLVWHFICLFFQLFGNFAFLAAIEGPTLDFLGVSALSPLRIMGRPISALSAILWSATLIVPRVTSKGTQDCPFIAKVFSVIAIAVAYQRSPSVSGVNIEIYGMIAFFIAWIISLFTRKSKVPPKKESVLILVIVVAKIVIYHAIMANSSLRGSLSAYSSKIIPLFIVGLILCSSRHDPVILTVAYGSVVGHILSALLDNSTMFLFCCAFTATVFQGLSHAVSGEDGTLVVLQEDKDEDSKLAYEWSHVVFFPNILLHACMQRVNLVSKSL